MDYSSRITSRKPNILLPAEKEIQKLVAAVKVVLLDPSTSEFLRAVDERAVQQLEEALPAEYRAEYLREKAEATPEVRGLPITMGVSNAVVARYMEAHREKDEDTARAEIRETLLSALRRKYTQLRRDVDSLLEERE